MLKIQTQLPSKLLVQEQSLHQSVFLDLSVEIYRASIDFIAHLQAPG